MYVSQRYTRGVRSIIRGLFASLTVRRSLGFFSRGNSLETTKVEKPKFTGNGPFVELPTFSSIGEPSKLLNITLPESSLLNIRDGSMVVINGEINGMQSVTKELAAGIEYQALRSSSPASLVINGNNKNYSVIRIENEEWFILNGESIVAWTGFDLELLAVRKLGKFTSFQSKGKGVLVVNGENNLVDLQLESGDEIWVSPSSFVASSTPGLEFGIVESETILGNTSFRMPKIHLPRYLLPREGLAGSVSNQIRSVNSQIKSKYSQLIEAISSPQISNTWNITKPYLRNTSHFIQLNLINSLRTKPIFFKIQGPGRLLLSNSKMATNRYTFTKEEIQTIFK
jgi:uncharacterized protein (AIM24 family)